jgi:RecB family exonuclease
MTKARQRERKRRMQRAAVAERTLAAADDREADEAMVKIIDVLFRGMAEKAAAENDISVEDAIKGSWTLFEGGFLRLVAGDDDRVEPCRENRVEQRAQAKKNKPLVEIKRRLLAEKADPAEPSR